MTNHPNRSKRTSFTVPGATVDTYLALLADHKKLREINRDLLANKPR